MTGAYTAGDSYTLTTSDVMLTAIDPEDLDSRALNLSESMAAQLSERDAEVQKVLDAMRGAPPAAGMDEKATEELKKFLKEIEPRHTAARAVGEQPVDRRPRDRGKRHVALAEVGDLAVIAIGPERA